MGPVHMLLESWGTERADPVVTGTSSSSYLLLQATQP